MLSAAAAAALRRGASPLLRRPAPASALPAGLRRGLAAGAPPPPPASPLPGHTYVDRSPRVEAMYTSRPTLLKAYAAVVVVSTPLSLYLTA